MTTNPKKRNTLLDPVLPVDWQKEYNRRYGPPFVQREPTGPALGNYPGPGDRRRTMGEKIARFLRDLADRAQSWT